MSQERSKNWLPYVLAVLGVVCFGIVLVKQKKPVAVAAPARVVVPVDAGFKPAPRETVPVPDVVATTPVASKRRVVMISVDGLSSALVAKMPHLSKMFAEGAGTLKALVPLGATTATSHAMLFTGADPNVSGVMCEPSECKDDGYTKADGVHSPNFRWRPLKVKDTLFTAIESAGYKAVAAVQKGKLVAFFRPSSDETGIISTNDTQQVVSTGCAAVQDDKTRLVVLHLKMIDHAGHAHGWLSEQQVGEASTIDDQLQQVRDCIDRANAASSSPSTVLIVTSDHGGKPGWRPNGRPYEHGHNDDDNRLVPWIAVGPGIKKGHEIAGRSDLAPIRAGSITPAILLVDTVPTILRYIGVSTSSIPTLSKHATSVDEIFSP